MGKGDWRRPTLVSREEADSNWESVFGPKKLNNMSDADREELGVERNCSGEVSGDLPTDEHVVQDLHGKGTPTSQPLCEIERNDCPDCRDLHGAQ
jgi:hypothetical protein